MNLPDVVISNPTRSWLIFAVLMVIVEILPPPTHFFFLCVALGALGAAISAFFFTSTPWLPWVVFGVTTIALTPMLIPLAKFLFTPKSRPSNVDALLGEKALVLELITPKIAGTVKIGGEVWRATSDMETFQKDQWVIVAKVDGAHLIVRSQS